MVRISEIADAMTYGDEFSAYYDMKENRVVIISRYDEIPVEEELRELVDSDEEGRFRHISRDGGFNPDWDDMERFAATIEDDAQRESLLVAISGKGAFRRFRMLTERFGLLDDWYSFKNDRLMQSAREWCEERSIPCE